MSRQRRHYDRIRLNELGLGTSKINPVLEEHSERDPLLPQPHRARIAERSMNSNTSSIPYKPFSSPALYSINQKTTNDTPEYSGLSDIANHLEVSNEDPGQQIISSKFESLDYDYCENTLQRKEQKSFTGEKYVQMNIYRWLIMLIIGVLTATVAVSIDISIDKLAGWKYKIIKTQLDKCVDSSCLAIPYCLWVGLNCAFVLMATLMVVYAEPVAAGSGIPQIKCYLNGVKIPHVVRIKTLLTKVVGVVFSVAGGLAVGKEGPMIHTGAVIAAGVSQGRSTTFNRDFHMFEMFRTDHEKRDFVAGGAAAGVSAAFGSPVGGVLFSLEEGSSFWNQALTWRMFFSSMISSFTLNVLLSIYNGQAGNLGYPGLINFGQFSGSYQGYELPLFMMMGVLGGLFGALFNAINHHLTIYRMRFVKNRPLRVIESLIVATMSSCVAFSLIYFYNDCQPVGSYNSTGTLQFFCPDGKFSAMGTLVFSTPEKSAKSLFHAYHGMYSIFTLIPFFICYFLLATWTYGLYVPSGLFVPVILCGAAMGRLFGELIHMAFPSGTWSGPGIYALIGAASLLGGVMRMTISLCVIVMEATGDITYGLPLMLCIIVAKWVGDFFNEGIYDIHIKLAGVPFLDWETPQMTSHISMSHVMKTPVACFHAEERVGRIIDVLKNTASHHNGFPVVDNVPQPGEGRKKTFGTFRGTILRSQLIILLKQKVFFDPGMSRPRRHRLTIKDFRDAYPRFPPIRNINISQRERECYIDLRPFMNPVPYTIQEKSSLNRGFRLFRALGLRHLVVVNENNQVIGIVTRKDLARYRTWTHRGQMGLEELQIMQHSNDED
ncbi:H(+)/Cl(-) exchange transporter 7-like [Hydractinia symbiolongicarpus]|uniref:H(+)/Cl(-) exchange transporter 7-like n=1 Tax=Hydractinia symbiolongicarpus TaxID=13093 RepID=UPI00254C8C59|nr:H(+)/Cl(-) exchange transporter 7-like [Hydractinia symbiolongicarpus]